MDEMSPANRDLTVTGVIVVAPGVFLRTDDHEADELIITSRRPRWTSFTWMLRHRRFAQCPVLQPVGVLAAAIVEYGALRLSARKGGDLH